MRKVCVIDDKGVNHDNNNVSDIVNDCNGNRDGNDDVDVDGYNAGDICQSNGENEDEALRMFLYLTHCVSLVAK